MKERQRQRDKERERDKDIKRGRERERGRENYVVMTEGGLERDRWEK